MKGRDETSSYPYQEERRIDACWSKKALRADEGPLGGKKKDRRNEGSAFSEKRWTHTCRTKKALAVNEGSLGGATESCGTQVVDQYNRNPQLTDSLRFQIGCGVKHCSREDSNLHGFPHTVLSRTRLPIPPREQNRWPLQCARASRLQGQTGQCKRRRLDGQKLARTLLPCANFQLVRLAYLAKGAQKVSII